MHGLLSKYMKRLDNELFKFKTDLEVNNSGVTDLIEKSKTELINFYYVIIFLQLLII